MTDQEFLMDAWEVNTAKMLAVQGEVNGRTLLVSLIDRNGNLDTTSNAEIVNRPLDLSNKAVQLYVYKPDKKACLLDGTVKDAGGGVVEFTLTEQATAVSGNAVCEIWVSDAAGDGLKIIGLTLNIEPSHAVNIVSTNEFQALTKATAEAKQATQEALDAANDARNITEDSQEAVQQAKQAAEQAQSAADAAGKVPYIGADGYWYAYNIELKQYEKTDVQASVMFATFELSTPDGELLMHTPENYKGAGFQINDNGELEVVV